MTQKESSWTADEEAYLIKNYSILGPKQCALQLNRTQHAIHNKARNLKLVHKHNGLKTQGEVVKMNLVDRFAGTYQAPVWLVRASGQENALIKSRVTVGQ